MDQSKRLVGAELWSHLDNAESLAHRSQTLFSWLKNGQFKIAEVTKYPLSQIAAAHRALESGTTRGKIILG
jgi:NADPH:quinone reductase-like Zn-dependent oxidoreductase